MGYVSCLKDKKNISEIRANSPLEFKEIIMQWAILNNTSAVFSLMPHMTEEIKLMYEICDDCNITSPSRFKILNWEKVIGAFMKLKSTYSELEDADYAVEIEGYGTVHIICKNNIPSCTKTNENGDIKLTPLEALRYFFDPMDTGFERKSNLPLPLSWNTMDRV